MAINLIFIVLKSDHITTRSNRPLAFVTFCAGDLHKNRQIPTAPMRGVMSNSHVME